MKKSNHLEEEIICKILNHINEIDDKEYLISNLMGYIGKTYSFELLNKYFPIIHTLFIEKLCELNNYDINRRIHELAKINIEYNYED